MADPFGIAGLTGTAEQVVRLVIALIDRHDAYKKNNDLALEMLEAYKALFENVMSLRDDPHLDIIQDPHRKILKDKIDRVSNFVETTLTELQDELKTPKGKLCKFSKAVSERDILVERKQDAAEHRKDVEWASAYLSLYGKIDSVAINKDVFMPCVWAPRNPDSVYIDLKLRHGHVAQDTCERKLKAAVLRNNGSAQVGAFAVGQGGVGKTCALRAIAHDDEVRARFPGGVYFLTLGQDASVGRLMQQFCLAVNVTRGHSTAEKMREQTELEEVLSLLVSWFGDRICLFIFDDVWARNGINKEILQQLSVLAGTGTGMDGATSRIMYSTRDRDLTLVGQSIAFGARVSRGSDAEMMLRQASGLLCDEENSLCSKEAIHTIHAILDMCAGLPLALNVAGTSVKYMKSQRRAADVSSIWQLYLDKVKNRGGMSSDSPGDGYSSLRAMLLSSIDILESNSKADGERRCGLSYRKMHRGLCVMKKQDWIPVSVLNDLWETDDEDAAEKLAMQMSNVGLVDFEYGRGCAGLRMHDLTLDFTVNEAEANEGCVAWFGKVVDKYSRERGLVAAAVEDGSLDDKGFRDEYVEENIYRLLMGAGRLEDLKNLVLSPGWVAKVLRRKAVLQYERAVKDLRNCWKWGEGRGEVDKDAISGMDLVMKAARLSVPFCDESTAGICFQLYARMMYKASSLESVRRFLSDMKAWAPEPWLCPVNECLHRAGNMVEVFTVPDQYRDGMRGCIFSNVSVGMDVREIFVGCAWNTDERDATIFIFSREEPVEVVLLNFDCEGPQLSVQDGDMNETVGSDTLEQNESMREPQRLSAEPEQAEQGSIFNRTRRWVVRTVSCFGKLLETCLRSSNISAMASNDTAASQASDASAGDNGTASDASDLGGVVRASVCGSGERVAVLYANGTAIVWGVSEKRAISRFQVAGRYEHVSSMFLSSYGQLLAVGYWYLGGTVQVWNVDEGTQVGAATCGDASPVTSIAISSDGRYLVSGSGNGNIRVWDVRSGSQLGQTMTGHTDAVSSVAMHEDGGQVLSGAWDRTVRFWDVKTGSQLGKSMTGHRAGVTSVAMSKDGKRAVSGSEDMTIRYWDLETQSQIGHPMAGHTGEVRNVAMSADGARALSGSTDGTLRMWDVKMEWEEEAVKTGHTAEVSCISLSENGKRVVSGSDDRTVRMWDAQSGIEIGNPVPVPHSYVASVAMSANGRRAMSGCNGGWIRCWDVRTGSQIGEANAGEGSRVNSIAIDGYGRLAVSGSDDGSVCVWDVDKGLQARSVLMGHTGEVWSVAISSDGARAISGSRDRRVLLWDTKSGSRVGDSKSGHSHGVWSVAMSANGRRAISGARNGTIMVWDVDTGLQVGETLEGDGTPIGSVAVCANGRVAVWGCSDGRVVIWNAENGSPVGKTMLDHAERVRSVAISADGSRAVSGSDDKSVIVWNTKTRTQVGQALIGHTSHVESVAMSENRSLVVSGSEDGSIRVWDANTGLQVGEAMAGHTSDVGCVATSSDGKYAVSGSYDGSTRIWDLKKGSEVTKTGHTSSVYSVVVSADGSRAVSISHGNLILAWDVETGLRVVGKAMAVPTSRVLSVAISANGRRTVSGWRDGSVRAWNTESGAQVCSALHGHEGWVWSVAISADGEWAVSGGADKTVQVWDLQAGAQSGRTLTGHTGTVWKVAISADGRRVVSWSWDDTVRVWDVTRGTCDRIMTEINWQRACFRSIIAETDASVSITPSRELLDIYCDPNNNKIMYRREDGVEVVLARFDVGTNSRAFQVDHRNGIVVAGLGNGRVAFLKLLS